MNFLLAYFLAKISIFVSWFNKYIFINLLQITAMRMTMVIVICDFFVMLVYWLVNNNWWLWGIVRYFRKIKFIHYLPMKCYLRLLMVMIHNIYPYEIKLYQYWNRYNHFKLPCIKNSCDFILADNCMFKCLPGEWRMVACMPALTLQGQGPCLQSNSSQTGSSVLAYMDTQLWLAEVVGISRFLSKLPFY